MPWFRIDDGFHCHPKVFAAGNAAAGLLVRLGSYSAQQLTDGRVPAMLVQSYGKRAEIDALIRVGILTRDGDDYLIRDYLDWNPSAEQLRADREATAERQRRWRDRHIRNGDRDAVTSHRDDAVTNAAPSHPIPERTTSSLRHDVATENPQPVDISTSIKKATRG